MLIKLDISNDIKFEINNSEYDSDIDDVRSILSDTCSVLSGSGGACFLVSGFGDNSWSVDIETDLPVFLEQLPVICDAIKKQNLPFCIDFYEQGIERSVYFEPKDDVYKIRCESQTDWSPSPNIEFIEKKAFLEMILEIRNNFLKVISINAPAVFYHPWLKEWQEKTVCT